MNLQEFFHQWIGKSVEVEDASALDQCFDWAFKYCQFLRIPLSAIRHQYARQIWTDATEETRQYFDLVANTPSGIPPAGAVVIFDQTVGYAGHVCVATGVGDTQTFQSTDQNWNSHSYVEYITHTYDGVVGWLVPKPSLVIVDTTATGTYVDALTFGRLVTEATEYEKIVKVGYTTADAITIRLNELQSQIEQLQKQVGQLTKDNQAMAMATQQDKNTIATLTDAMQQQATSDATAIDSGLQLNEDMQKVAKALTTTYPPLTNITSRIDTLLTKTRVVGQVKSRENGTEKSSSSLLSRLIAFLKKYE